MNRTAISVLEEITHITNRFLEGMKEGYKEPQRGFVFDVEPMDLFEIYGMLQGKEHHVRLFVPGEFSDDNYVIVYELCAKNFIFIESKKMIPLKPKVKLINYN